MLFATRDINDTNLKVDAGRALPNRFQNRTYLRGLIEAYGAQAVVDIDWADEKFILIENEALSAIKAENAQLKADNAQLNAQIAQLTKPNPKPGNQGSVKSAGGPVRD